MLEEVTKVEEEIESSPDLNIQILDFYEYPEIENPFPDHKEYRVILYEKRPIGFTIEIKHNPKDYDPETHPDEHNENRSHIDFHACRTRNGKMEINPKGTPLIAGENLIPMIVEFRIRDDFSTLLSSWALYQCQRSEQKK